MRRTDGNRQAPDPGPNQAPEPGPGQATAARDDSLNPDNRILDTKLVLSLESEKTAWKSLGVGRNATLGRRGASISHWRRLYHRKRKGSGKRQEQASLRPIPSEQRGVKPPRSRSQELRRRPPSGGSGSSAIKPWHRRVGCLRRRNDSGRRAPPTSQNRPFRSDKRRSGLESPPSKPDQPQGSIEDSITRFDLKAQSQKAPSLKPQTQAQAHASLRDDGSGSGSTFNRRTQRQRQNSTTGIKAKIPGNIGSGRPQTMPRQNQCIKISRQETRSQHHQNSEAGTRQRNHHQSPNPNRMSKTHHQDPSTKHTAKPLPHD